jgi:3-methyladenine DNA glycosylase/8-oxoguanine DNA glycosylase
MRIAPARDGWRLTGWGPGAGAAAAAVPRLLGAEDDPTALRLADDRLRRRAARLGGLRFGRSDDVWASLVPAILGQKVTGAQALRSWHGLLRRFGEAAPGPRPLRLPPEPEVIADLRYEQLHPFGIEQRRALTLIRSARRAAWLQEAASVEPGAALARLRSIPGVGPWTAAEVARPAFGDPDAVSLGDFHLPNLVCWALAGEPRGDDERMLELLEPYRGQRARLVRILEHSGIHAPRFGPRLAVRSIEGL